MKKRILSILLVLVMVIGMIPFSALSASAADTEDLRLFGGKETSKVETTDYGTWYEDDNGHVVLKELDDTTLYWIDRVNLTSAYQNPNTWSEPELTANFPTGSQPPSLSYYYTNNFVSNLEFVFFKGSDFYRTKSNGAYQCLFPSSYYETSGIIGVHTSDTYRAKIYQSVRLYDTGNQNYYVPDDSAYPVGSYVVEYQLKGGAMPNITFDSGERMKVTLDGAILGESDVQYIPNTYYLVEKDWDSVSSWYHFDSHYRYDANESEEYQQNAKENSSPNTLYHQLYAYGEKFYVYDEKPEIKTVLVNGESVADGATYISNSKSVTVKTTYDSVLSQALQDYGCTVKYKTSLNGLDYSNVTTSTSNGNGTSTQTYVQNVNSGSSLTFKSWLEVTWPDGSKDRVDERTTNVIYVDMGFASLTPTPDMDEADWDELASDLGTMALGSADTNINFNFSAKALSAEAIAAGYSVKRALKVTRDGITVYDKEYASNEVYPWNLKDNIDEGGNYHIIPTLNYYLNGVKIEEISHLYTVKVTGSTIKTISLAGIGTPVIGKAPSTIDTAISNTDGVIIKKVQWEYWTSEMGGGFVNMPDGSVFEEGKRYAVLLELETADGYLFAANKTDMTIYINGQKANLTANYATNKFGVELEIVPITPPAFTTQPVGGMVAEGDKLTVDWELNFAPAKVELRYFDNALEESRPTFIDASISSADFAPIADDGSYYQILAYYNNTQYVASNKFYVYEIKTIINTIAIEVAKPVIGEATTKPTIKSVNGDENLKDLVSFFSDSKVYWVEADSAEDIANGNKNPTVFADGKIYALHVAIQSTKEIAEDCVLNVYGTDGELLWSGNISFSDPSDKTLVYTDAYLGNFKLEIGNVNGDDLIDFTDLQRLYQHITGDNPLSGDALGAADVNADTVIDFSDLQALFALLSQNA